MEIVAFLGKTLAWIFGITGLLANITIIMIVIAVKNGATFYFGYRNTEEDDSE